MAVQSDGKIVVVGSVATGIEGTDFAITRLNPDGSLDVDFGVNGSVTIIDFGGGGSDNDTPNAVAIAANGDIYVAGQSATGATTNAMAIAALSPNGAELPGFGNSGQEFVSFGGTNESANGIAIQPDGKLVLVGTTNAVPANDADMAIARLDPNTGALDTSFNGTGKKTINFGGNSTDVGIDVAVQSDGKIVVAGQSLASGSPHAAAARLTSAGSLDTSFGSGGLQDIDLGGSESSANRVLIQPTGRIVLVGGNFNDIVVARLLETTGALDTSFNGTGLITTVIGSPYDGTGGALTPDGRIVVVGSSLSNNDGAVARVIGTVERPLSLSVGGSLDGRATLFTPDTSTGQYSAAASTPAGVFPGFAGDVRTAVGDVNGDGVPDTVLVTGPGTPIRLAVVSGVDNTTLLVQPTAPFVGSESFIGGGFVAVSDLDNDGRGEVIVTPDQGGGPRVTIFSLQTDGTLSTRANFFGTTDPNFRGGARAAAGDVDGDGTPDLIVAAGFGGGPRVAIFKGTSLLSDNPIKMLNDFFAFPEAGASDLRNGVYVAAGDINGDGFADLIIGAGPGGSPRLFVLSGSLLSTGNIQTAYDGPLANFFVAGNSSDRGGVRVAATDADGDNKAEIVTGSGEGSPSKVRIYLGKSFTSTVEPTNFQDLDPFGGAVLSDGVFVG